MSTAKTAEIERLLAEYHRAQEFSVGLLDGLDEEQITWRPHERSSAIGWHIGHQAAVNHYMVRNLTAAEPTLDAGLDRLFDSATIEPERRELPPTERTLAYREAVTAFTDVTIGRIAAGDVGAPDQLALIAQGLLVALVNHEYQHDTWILEVRRTLGVPAPDPVVGGDLVVIDGYPVLTTF